jgi:hypothetical protein
MADKYSFPLEKHEIFGAQEFLHNPETTNHFHSKRNLLELYKFSTANGPFIATIYT